MIKVTESLFVYINPTPVRLLSYLLLYGGIYRPFKMVLLWAEKAKKF